MRRNHRLSTVFAIAFSIPFFFLSVSADAQSRSYNRGYDHGYDNGYDDGYEDCMDDCPCPPGRALLRSGLYFGLGGGFEGFQVERKPIINDDRIGSLNTHANGWTGRIFGGFGQFLFFHYYLAAEVFASKSNARGTDDINSTPQYDGRFTAGTSYGLSLLPGYRSHDTGPLYYARLGYINSDLEVKDASGSNSSTYSKWTSGLNAGFGLEVPLYQKLSARFEYDYIDYDSFSQGGTTGSNNSPSDNRAGIDLLLHY